MAEQEQPDQRYTAGATTAPRNKPLHYLITDQFRYELMASTNNMDIKERLRVYLPITQQGMLDMLVDSGFVKRGTP